jgi:thiosulfate/3-mercaptopyruvate sulfurtransferase
LLFVGPALDIEIFIRYDTHGIFSAPRALFMFRSFGHEQSSVLDGGLPRWEYEGLPTESGPVMEIPRTGYPAPALASENIRSESSRDVL